MSYLDRWRDGEREREGNGYEEAWIYEWHEDIMCASSHVCVSSVCALQPRPPAVTGENPRPTVRPH
jgi:hypothetical protein